MDQLADGPTKRGEVVQHVTKNATCSNMQCSNYSANLFVIALQIPKEAVVSKNEKKLDT